MIVGIFGMGVTGTALYEYISETRPDTIFRKVDPAIGYETDVSDCDAIFVCVPAPTLEDGTQDQSQIISCIKQAPMDVPIFVRSTTVPDFFKHINNKNVIHMPEFLTESRALHDMHKLPLVVGSTDGDIKRLIEKIFLHKKVIYCDSTEASLGKYIHNALAAVKVNFFNNMSSLCFEYGADYEKVLDIVTSTGFFTREHTEIARDGLPGYGGKCLPKDLKAITKVMEDKRILQIDNTLAKTTAENEFRRNIYDRDPETIWV